MVVDELCHVPLPTIAVLGDHDLHSDQGDEITEILEAGGITVLDRSGIVVEVGEVRVGSPAPPASAVASTARPHRTSGSAR